MKDNLIQVSKGLQKGLKQLALCWLIMGIGLATAHAATFCDVDDAYEKADLSPDLLKACNPNPTEEEVSLSSVSGCSSAAYPPSFFLRHLATLLLRTIQEKSARLETEPAYLHQVVADILLPSFDQEKMAALTVMQYWRSATVQEKSDFIEEYKKKIVHDYGSNVLKFKDEEVCIPTMHVKKECSGASGDCQYPKRLRVDSLVTSPNSKPIDVQYRIRRDESTPGKPVWRVYNFKVAGLNMAASYRAQFQEVLGKKGQGFPALIKKLKKLNERHEEKTN